MAINKNNYLDVDGNYDLKKSLVDELIDEVNQLQETLIGTPSFENGFTAGTFKVEKKNGIVSLFGTIEGDVTSSFKLALTLPVGFRPKVILFPSGITAWPRIAQIQLNDTGGLYVRGTQNETGVSVALSYIVD